ncbi:MAG: 2-C-methyl-D-erythritol 2,4-cyclodiphosphate synthase [Pelotomaculum sp.]|uniref:2-C-methyl-D-erythritol 2,4-cyclodiphosphate synthase n=1 Tax=Pelotomaculum thermopropionicum (strain DSM 13744 / JCM 10971 / SI) TaxID=370438 RepID=ISPF_PELTS|nr:RecName: Full=2-C-methyl-D-erythritol 2,4-cyclodiphosphate synthase; Short=MECDP-synthase; Short=MECPP-synthase; Short=MECPS [Pelotomaculum thermopropionicum SI]NPV74174.1 2-C-methyl-D-erythritol 2,4-cyclodiphosphate synthase [Pelotomaculum sp.]BAF58471.1 2C-methyl-D-erythritol 2,4-cyclodiphosphate synthase [Pelotomaculum thermopropionicum SI]
MRVGFGYDVHKLVEGRPLVLGGVSIPFVKGLLGHSDADVLAHAVMDALLGAAGAGDIGRHFPDNDGRYKGISSMKLLARVGDILSRQGLAVVNIDSVVVAQGPKLSPFIEEMQKRMAGALQIQPSQVSVKATTTEGLGFAGKGEGIAAYAVALVHKTGQAAT